MNVTFRKVGEPDEPQDLEALRRKHTFKSDDSLMLKTYPEIRTYPMRLELAGFYSDDADDFLRRYRLAFYSEEINFQAKKSRRAKAYVDLRMALEALLKAIVCLRAPYGLAGAPLVKKIRGHSHNCDSLMSSAFEGILLGQQVRNDIAKCNIAPVDLRYQFDAMNFRSPDDRNYYETIGSNAWLKTMENFVEAGLKRIQPALNRRSKIVPGKIALEELRRPRDYA
jgi:hypothetical protein